MTYVELLPHLIQNSLVVPIPLKPIQPPYPKNYNPNAKCDYHADTIGHTTEKCWGLKYKVQDLMDMGLLSFKENGPNVKNNLLLGHEVTSINVIEGDVLIAQSKEKHNTVDSTRQLGTPITP
ncbi:hypothetical protein CR513_09005, partial [Mucuna pruriens]